MAEVRFGITEIWKKLKVSIDVDAVMFLAEDELNVAKVFLR